MRYSVYSRGIWISRPIPISTSNTSVKPQCHSLTQTPSCGTYTVNQCLKKINPHQSSPSNCNPMKMNTRKVKVEVVAARSSCQPPLSMEFSCSVVLPASSVHGILQAILLEWGAVTSPGDLPDPGIKPESSALYAASLPSEPPEKP